MLRDLRRRRRGCRSRRGPRLPRSARRCRDDDRGPPDAPVRRRGVGRRRGGPRVRREAPERALGQWRFLLLRGELRSRGSPRQRARARAARTASGGGRAPCVSPRRLLGLHGHATRTRSSSATCGRRAARRGSFGTERPLGAGHGRARPARLVAGEGLARGRRQGRRVAPRRAGGLEPSAVGAGARGRRRPRRCLRRGAGGARAQ